MKIRKSQLRRIIREFLLVEADDNTQGSGEEYVGAVSATVNCEEERETTKADLAAAKEKVGSGECNSSGSSASCKADQDEVVRLQSKLDGMDCA